MEDVSPLVSTAQFVQPMSFASRKVHHLQFRRIEGAVSVRRASTVFGNEDGKACVQRRGDRLLETG